MPKEDGTRAKYWEILRGCKGDLRGGAPRQEFGFKLLFVPDLNLYLSQLKLLFVPDKSALDAGLLAYLTQVLKVPFQTGTKQSFPTQLFWAMVL